MQKFDILDPKLDIYRSTFLEASAGTGKTFAIEHLVARLVKTIPLEQILAVTFTREAAAEMKERIRAKLDDCSEEEINVFTIHGFCHHCLTEFAFEANTPMQLSGADTPDHLEEMEQVVEDFLRTGDPAFAGEVSEQLKKARYDLSRLKKQIVAAMEKPASATDLKAIAMSCRKRWEEKAARFDHFSFDDLLGYMEKALAIPAFKEKVQAKYRAVIVDEFQDTDPLQWTIFANLFLENHLLYLVGDPKQSIYGFRSADIYTYMRAKEALKDNIACLDTNFRSSPQLIDALNDLFQKKSGWIDLPSLPGSLEYYPVYAGRRENRIREEPITYFGVRADPGRMRTWPTQILEEAKLFPYIASKILHHKQDFAFSDMVVLIKDRHQARRLQLFLKRYQIPSSIKRTLHLAESRGYLAMEMLLQAIARPSHEMTVQTALSGPLMHQQENPFYELKALFEEKGFAPTFAYFIEHLYTGSSALYFELRQTAELLMQERRKSLAELLHQMHVWKQVSPEVDERLALSFSDADDEVAIMTTFASKGLEFEIVFALDMASSSKQEERTEEKEAEKMRKLYVAFTRAREKLYIPRLFDTSESFPPSPIERLFEGIDVAIEWIKETPLSPYLPEKQIREPPLEPPELTYPIEFLTSFTSLAKPQSHTLLYEAYRAQDLTQKTLHTLPLGAETGTVIHAIFEHLFEERSASIEQVVCETLTGTHLEGWEEVLSDMVNHIMQMPLLDGFCLSDLQEGEYFQEMEFLYPEKNQWIKGFADLVFKRGNTFYLLDWKTNWLGQSDEHYTKERIHVAMQEHDYYLQAKLYQEALMRYVNPLYTNAQFGGAIYVFLRGRKSIGTC